jgi:hypothetical protein
MASASGQLDQPVLSLCRNGYEKWTTSSGETQSTPPAWSDNVSFPPLADIAVSNASLAMASAEQTLETAESINAACRWVLRHRADGRFDYTEYQFVDLRPEGHVEGYWERSYTSGLFETAQAARDDALEAIPWLPGQL